MELLPGCVVGGQVRDCFAPVAVNKVERHLYPLLYSAGLVLACCNFVSASCVSFQRSQMKRRIFGDTYMTVLLDRDETNGTRAYPPSVDLTRWHGPPPHLCRFVHDSELHGPSSIGRKSDFYLHRFPNALCPAYKTAYGLSVRCSIAPP
jgi:hypothetical protein